MHEKNGVLVFNKQRQSDTGVLAGIRYGMSIKGFRKQELSSAETDLDSRIKAFEKVSLREAPEATFELSASDAVVATEAIKRNLDFQVRYDTWSHVIGDHDRTALPAIELLAQTAQVSS